jgi:SPP1 family predicted phage head-tail adaptor
MLTRLRQRLDIQTLSVTSAGGGCFDETWTTTATRWANVQIQRASEEFSYNKDQQANFYRILMRKESFTNKNRFVFNGLVLTIQSISDPTSAGRMMEVLARGEPA